MKKQAVIFDLDGTLLDTLDDLADSANRVLDQLGFPTHSVDAFRYFVGDGVGELVRQMLPEDRRDRQTMADITDGYRREYGQHWNVKTRPYDGIEAMLDELTARGVRIAVLSNKPDVYTQQCVSELLSSWRFDPVIGHHDGIPRKPDPAGAFQIADRLELSPAEIAYVGDTGTDMQTAVAAGMFAIGVVWGFRPEEELRSNGADAIAAEPRELIGLISGD